MSDGDVDKHPDLIDPKWVRQVNRRAKADVRQMHRAAFFRNHRKTLFATVAALAVSTLVSAVISAPGLGALTALTRAGASPGGAGAPPTTATSRVRARIDLNQPFANTPAAGWADGAQGIVPPAPAPAGPYTAAQVASAQTSVKQALINAHLDPAMLRRHDPTAYLALFSASDQAATRPRLAPGHEKDAATDVTMLADGHQLLPAPPKVRGTMSASTDPFGNLLVHTNYVFAYAFADAKAADLLDPMEIVAVQHFQSDFIVISDEHYGAGDRGLWHDTSKSFGYSVNCAESAKGFLAPSYRVATGMAHDQTDPDAYFDPAHQLAISKTCGANPQ